MYKNKVITIFLLNVAILQFFLLRAAADITVEGPEEVQGEAGDEGNKFSYNASSFRDPFKTFLPTTKEEDNGYIKVEEEPILPDFQVQGVVWDSKVPQAIINNTVVGIGDTIKEATIINITRDYIKLMYQKKYFDVPTTYTKYFAAQGLIEAGIEGDPGED